MFRVEMIDIAADEPPRAIRFYEQVFGWRIRKWEGPTDYWLIQTGDDPAPGINAGLAKSDDPGQFITPFISVPSVDEYAAKVVAGGGTIPAEDGDTRRRLSGGVPRYRGQHRGHDGEG